MKAVRTFIEKHQLLKKKATVLVGVSGGPDSMALLHFLNSLRQEWELEVIALTVDHKLRGAESAADADYVEDFCRNAHIHCERAEVDVPSYKKERGIGTQTAARELRYQFFKQQMEKHGADYLALGHHGDDQAETMLMQFTRSASPESVTGIPIGRPFACGRIIRPLLSVDRETIEAYCLEVGIVPRTDPSNEDTAYTRNYFRKLVIPLLKEKNPNIHVTLQHLSERMREDEAYLKQEGEKRLAQLLETGEKGSSVSFSCSGFLACPIALQRQMYQLILSYLYKKLPDQLAHVHEVQFFSLIGSRRSNVSIDFPEGLHMVKSYDSVSLSFDEKRQNSSYEHTLNLPGTTRLPGGARIEAKLSECGVQDTYTFSFCATPDMLPLVVRTRRPGDRMDWHGLNGTRKLKDLFIDEKIPKQQRDSWPIIVDATGRILWLPGLRKVSTTMNCEGSMACLKYID